MSWAHKRTSQPPWGDNVGLSWGLDHCASLIGDGHHWPPSDDDLAVRVQSTHIATINWKLCLREPNSQLIHYLVLVIRGPQAMMLP